MAQTFLSDPGLPGVRSMGPSVSNSVRVTLTHLVTLADEVINSIPTDNANRAIQGNVAMQMAPPGGQLCKQCCSLVMKLTGHNLLLYFHYTETYFENAVNNGSFSKHGVA